MTSSASFGSRRAIIPRRRVASYRGDIGSRRHQLHDRFDIYFGTHIWGIPGHRIDWTEVKVPMIKEGAVTQARLGGPVRPTCHHGPASTIRLGSAALEAAEPRANEAS